MSDYRSTNHDIDIDIEEEDLFLNRDEEDLEGSDAELDLPTSTPKLTRLQPPRDSGFCSAAFQDLSSFSHQMIEEDNVFADPSEDEERSSSTTMSEGSEPIPIPGSNLRSTPNRENRPFFSLSGPRDRSYSVSAQNSAMDNVSSSQPVRARSCSVSTAFPWADNGPRTPRLMPSVSRPLSGIASFPCPMGTPRRHSLQQEALFPNPNGQNSSAPVLGHRPNHRPRPRALSEADSEISQNLKAIADDLDQLQLAEQRDARLIRTMQRYGSPEIRSLSKQRRE